MWFQQRPAGGAGESTDERRNKMAPVFVITSHSCFIRTLLLVSETNTWIIDVISKRSGTFSLYALVSLFLRPRGFWDLNSFYFFTSLFLHFWTLVTRCKNNPCLPFTHFTETEKCSLFVLEWRTSADDELVFSSRGETLLTTETTSIISSCDWWQTQRTRATRWKPSTFTTN